MARRVNTKFVIVLVVCLVGVGAALGATWYVSKKTGAASAAREADEAKDQGEFVKATELYAKAIRHRDYATDIDLMLDASDAHSQVPVSEVRDARMQIAYMFSWLDRAILVDAREGRALLRKMQLQMELGRALGQLGTWDQMFYDAQGILDSYPDLQLGIKFRGISQVYRMAAATTNLTPDERGQAYGDLTRAMELFPDDPDVLEHLARWHVLEAQILDRLGGDEAKAQENREEALRVSSESIENHPDNARRLGDHITILLALKTDPKQVRPQVEKLYEQLTAEPASPRMTGRAVSLRLQLSIDPDETGPQPIDPDDIDEARKLVEAALTKHADHPLLRLVLGRLHQQSKAPELAEADFKKAWESDLEVGSMEFAIRYSVKAQGGLSYLSMAMNDVESLTDHSVKVERAGEIESQLEQIKGEVGDISAINELESRISAARGDYTRTVQKLQKLVDLQSGGSIAVLLRAADAQAKTGEWGAAAETLESVLKRQPQLLRVRQRLVEMYLGGHMLDQAERHVDTLLEKHEENEDDEEDEDITRKLRCEMLVRQEKFDQAAELLDQIDLGENKKLAIRLAYHYDRLGQNPQALRMLRDLFEQTPDDVELVYWLVKLDKDKARQQVYVSKCREAGGREENLDMLAEFVEAELDPEQEIEKRRQEAMEKSDHPALRMVRQYRKLVDDGNRTGADAELAAMKDEPFYTVVVWNVFLNALPVKDWDTAERMATLARDGNHGEGADYAKGMFYMGRYNMARGRHERAIDNFRSGLEMRKIYSDGWRMLGNALAQVQDYDGAVDAFRTAVKQRPNNRAMLALASAYYSRGENDQALDLLRTAHGREPDDYEVTDLYLQYELKYGDSDKALAQRQQIARDDADNMGNRRALAMALAEMERYDDARGVITQLIEKEGRTLANVMAMARVLSDGDDKDEAGRILRRHIQDKGKDAQVEDYLTVGREMIRMGEEDLGFNAYRQAIRIEDSKLRPATRELAAQLLNREETVAEAAELYEELWHSDASDMQVGRAYTMALIRNEELDKAESVVNRIATEGADLQSLLLSAQIALKRGAVDEALAGVDSAIELAPRRAGLLVTKAELTAADPSRAEEVLPLLDRALKLNPTLSSARLMKARVYRARGEVNSAIGEYVALLRRSPKQEDARNELAGLYRFTQQKDVLKTLLDESAQLFPDSATWPRQQAFYAKDEDELDEAVAKMQVAFDLDSSAPMLYDLVTILLEAEKPNESLKTLRVHADLVNDETYLQALRARAMVMIHRVTEASDVFASAMSKTENLAEFLQVRNQILEAIRYRTTAELNYGAIADLLDRAFGGNRPTWVELGVADLEFRANDFEAALGRLEPLESKVAAQPANERFFYYKTYSSALHMAEQYEKAAEAYRQLLELSPDNALAMNNLAYVLTENLDQPEEAVEMAQRAIELQPDNALVLDTLGWALFKTGRNDGARAALENSVKQQRSASNCMHLAEVLLKLELRPEAIEMLESARRLAEQSNDSQTAQTITNRLEEVGQ